MAQKVFYKTTVTMTIISDQPFRALTPEEVPVEAVMDQLGQFEDADANLVLHSVKAQSKTITRVEAEIAAGPEWTLNVD